MADYSDLFGGAGLGVADHYVNQRAPMIKALGSNAQALDLAVLAGSVFFPQKFGRYGSYVQGAAAGASYATARRLMTHFTGTSTALDTSSGFERVAPNDTPPAAHDEPAFALAATEDDGDNW